MKKQVFKYDNYTIHTIKTNKFKRCNIEVVFRNKFTKQDITYRNVLFDILCESSIDYPTNRELSLKLEDLYASNIYNSNMRLGNTICSKLGITFINPKLVNDNYVEDAIKVLFSLINKPLINDKVLQLIKERNLDVIKSVKEESSHYASVEVLKYLGNTPSAYHNLGYIEDLLTINIDNIKSYYQSILDNDNIDIYVIGNLDMDSIVSLINKFAAFKNRSQLLLYYNVINKLKETQIVNEHYFYKQTNVVMILTTNNLTSFEKKYVMTLYNLIFGGGSLETKLYRKLRHDNSLCYVAGSIYNRFDNLITIRTSIMQNTQDKAIGLIKETLEDMKNNITVQELERAKSIIQSSLKNGEENINMILSEDLFNYYYGSDSLHVKEKKFQSVTLDDLQKINSKISINIIYTLIGDDVNEEE